MTYPRDFFDLQIAFAERVAAATGVSLERALFDHTNLYVRLGLGRNFDWQHVDWQDFVRGLNEHRDVRERTYQRYLANAERNTAPAVNATFGCFSYALQVNDVLRLHFRPKQPAIWSPLGSDCVDARRRELHGLFSYAKQRISPNAVVVGASWLYNLPAYQRLFPAAYTQSAQPVRGRFTSMSLWGQFLDYRGDVKPTVRQRFVERLALASRTTDWNECFPLPVLTTHTPIQAFYEFYGV